MAVNRGTPTPMKDEGLISCILEFVSLGDAKKVWRVQRLFHKVLDEKVIPLLALYERDWTIVRYYMDIHSDGLEEYPRFHYNFDTIATEAILHQDFEGLQLLASRKYDFQLVHGDIRLHSFARESLRTGSLEQLFMLSSVGFDYSTILAECIAQGELSSLLSANRTISFDFFNTRSVYQCTALDFASHNYVDSQLHNLCGRRDTLFRVPFIMASFMRAGASCCSFMRPGSCGYLLLLALASESFNFVYLLVKEAVHLNAVLERYRTELQLMIKRALEHGRLTVLELIAFCGFQLQWDLDHPRQFDGVILDCLQKEDFMPIECLCRLGFSLLSFAERNHVEFHTFVQSRLEKPGEVGTEEASPGCTPRSPSGVHPSIRRLMALDRRSLELHFRSRVFLDFVGSLLARKSFSLLQEIVQIHPHAIQPYFAEHYVAHEAFLLNAFHSRDGSLIVDMSLLAFPMARLFARHQVELDHMLLGWLQGKCWTELGMLKSEVPQANFPAMFERNQGASDALALQMIKGGYWFDLHNLSSLAFEFPTFFHRRFPEVSEVVVSFTVCPNPHFVLLRELSALRFPWARFMDAHREQITVVRDRDFLQFVMSLDSFELGSKVYELVKETCCLYHSMATAMFDSHSATTTLSTLEDVSSKDWDLGNSDGPFSSSSSSSRHPKKHRPGPAQSDPSSSSSSTSNLVRATEPSVDELFRHAATDKASDPKQHMQQLAELVQKSQQRHLDAKKVAMLLVCKGAYCWSPLPLNPDDADIATPPSTSTYSHDALGAGARARQTIRDDLREKAWQHVEVVRSFLETPHLDGPVGLNIAALLRIPGPGPGANLNLAGVMGPMAAAPPGLLGGALPGVVGGLPGPLGAAVVAPGHGLPPRQLLNLRQRAVVVQPPPPAIPPAGPAAVNAQPHTTLHLTCFVEPREVHFFQSNLDIFWEDVLATTLPLEP